MEAFYIRHFTNLLNYYQYYADRITSTLSRVNTSCKFDVTIVFFSRCKLFVANLLRLTFSSHSQEGMNQALLCYGVYGIVSTHKKEPWERYRYDAIRVYGKMIHRAWHMCIMAKCQECQDRPFYVLSLVNVTCTIHV